MKTTANENSHSINMDRVALFISSLDVVGSFRDPTVKPRGNPG